MSESIIAAALILCVPLFAIGIGLTRIVDAIILTRTNEGERDRE